MSLWQWIEMAVGVWIVGSIPATSIYAFFFKDDKQKQKGLAQFSLWWPVTVPFGLLALSLGAFAGVHQWVWDHTKSLSQILKEREEKEKLLSKPPSDSLAEHFEKQYESV